jgi:SAM-dependent methyltransferase
MTDSASQKWNKRFSNANTASTPAEILHHHLHFLPPQGSALDLACGLGGNALLLAQCGLTTSAWDIADTGLKKLQLFASRQKLLVTTRQIDLENDVFPNLTFDVITVSRYLHRPLFANIVAALNKGGTVFYQTFTANGSRGAPSNPNFLLTDNELLERFSNLETLFYRQDNNNDNQPNMAYYIGRKLR